MNDVFLTHAAVCLPNEPVSNDEMEAVLGMPTGSPSRARRAILRSNGITQRYYVIDKRSGKVTHTNAQLTAAAVRNLGAAGVPLGQMDLLVCGTTLPDQLMPNHALMVHGELGLPALEAVATSGICLAGMSALKYAWLAVRSGESRLAVTTGSDVASLAMRAQQYLPETEHQARDLEQRPELAFEKDFLRWMLSDGAGAWAMQARPRPEGRSLRIEWVELFSYANELPVCMYAGATKGADGRLTGWMAHTPDECRDQSVFAIKQDVRLLNQFIAPMTVGKPLAALKSRRGLGAGTVDWLLPHVSSCYFIEPLARALATSGLPIPRERWFTNLVEKGNTGAASPYIMLEEFFNSDRMQPGARILLFVPESGRFSAAFAYLTVV